MSWVRIFHLWWGVNGGVVHGRGFESFTLEGQWWCSAWHGFDSFTFWGVNGGVVHGPGLEPLSLWESMVVWCMSWVRMFVFSGVINGGVVHGLGFEFLSFGDQWLCSAWSWVRIFDFWGQCWCSRRLESLTFGVNGGIVHCPGFESLTLWKSMLV
jgi:hypothetical protein